MRPLFVSDQQIEAGELIERGFEVLVLPRLIAMSDEAAAAMRKFVETGGTLVADSFVGRMDEHCREREVGVLDRFLGIKRLEGDRAQFELEPADAPAFAVLPYEVDGLDLSVVDGTAQAVIKSAGEVGEHVFRFEVIMKASEQTAGEGIRPYVENSFYWQYHGEPIVLIGGGRRRQSIPVGRRSVPAGGPRICPGGRQRQPEGDLRMSGEYDPDKELVWI